MSLFALPFSNETLFCTFFGRIETIYAYWHLYELGQLNTNLLCVSCNFWTKLSMRNIRVKSQRFWSTNQLTSEITFHCDSCKMIHLQLHCMRAPQVSISNKQFGVDLFGFSYNEVLYSYAERDSMCHNNGSISWFTKFQNHFWCLAINVKLQ